MPRGAGPGGLFHVKRRGAPAQPFAEAYVFATSALVFHVKRRHARANPFSGNLRGLERRLTCNARGPAPSGAVVARAAGGPRLHSGAGPACFT
jgi:hypothetical protein